jgi:hypothetical protein
MEDIVPFIENAAYTAEQVGKIIHRNTKTVRDMCRRGVLAARMDRGGYLITGWALRAYLENRSVVK